MMTNNSNISEYTVNLEIASRLVEKQARKFCAIILAEDQGKLILGMVDPDNLLYVDELHRILKKPLRFLKISEEDFLERCEQTYSTSTRDVLINHADRLAAELKNSSLRGINASDNEPAVMQFIVALFEQALLDNASDIHIEPSETILRVRFRIDGSLQEQTIPLGRKTGVVAALTQRLKLMSRLNISEKRLPQDGRFDLELKGIRFSVRLSTMPTLWGESVVMRLLRKNHRALDLGNSGMLPETLKTFRSLIQAPHGIILVTGPTGSGKTTTLYGALLEVSDVTKNVVTIEDPIEYELDRANQVQINTAIGLSFADTLRAVLRQDPDVILIGEIRDQETAEIALRSALTGHTVFSTLHTNDAAGVVERLIDMGLEPYLIAAALRGAVAQRLVRKVCPYCMKVTPPTEEERAFFTGVLGDIFDKYQYVKGEGCRNCKGLGVKGMTGVFEMLIIDDELRTALKKGGRQFNEQLRKQTKRSSLFNSAFELATQQIIPLSEVLKIAGV